MSKCLWKPSSVEISAANITSLQEMIARQENLDLSDYAAFYQWSLQQPEKFWSAIWDHSDVIALHKGETVLVKGEHMLDARWFPQARLNFAENLLRRRDNKDALVFWGEDRIKQHVSHAELYDKVSQLAQALKALGVAEGDRVAGYLPNIPETVMAMLATSSIGAVWSSCSPDFGVDGVVDRFGQIEPKVLFAADGYFYNNKQYDSLDKIAEIQKRIPGLERLVMVPHSRNEFSLSRLKEAIIFSELIAAYKPDQISFKQLPFNHPLYIMFSSGTTGIPKCIVHAAGGTLLQHLKEHRYHCNVKADDRIFYFTTCGWMMWNWLVSALASEATPLLYDGSPFYPDGNVLFDLAEKESMTLFGTSAKYIDALKKAGLSPGKTHDLSTLRTITSTGSPLVPEAFDYVYAEIKKDICLSSISGGTDLISCFALGNPTLPVYRGELQCRGLGMKVEVWNDNGESVKGEKGELVCTAPFPSMPVSFWKDPDGDKYRKAYFERFPNVWCHGDYVELTENDGMIFYGRSDAVLNPGGVRIGTAEIYRQVEQLEDVIESLVIGQSWEDDVRVVLFVHLREGLPLQENLIAKIKQQIRANTTPRHVPARIVQVNEIPRTKSGKIVELAVREIVHGRPVKNREALANPQALEQFANREELQN